MQAFYDAEDGALAPFVLVLEGSVPDEQLSGDGYWTGFGVNEFDGQPITVNEWVDRLAPKASAILAVGTCATHGGIPAMRNKPPRARRPAPPPGRRDAPQAPLPAPRARGLHARRIHRAGAVRQHLRQRLAL